MTTKGIPSIPDVPANVKDEDLYRILEPLKRIIDIRQGRFDPLDRWITQQDLIDAGLQTTGGATSSVVVVPGTQQYPFTLTGDVTAGPVQLGTGNPVVMSTVIDLPNIVCIDGGDASSTYPPSLGGPYGVQGGGQPIIVQDEGATQTSTVSLFNFVGAGVTATPAGDQITVTIPGGGGGGSALEVQDSGVPLSVATTLLNFVGFNLTEPVTDEITISFGASTAAGTVCPGYGFNFISTASWSIIGYDTTNQFSVGRRLRFTDGASTYFGIILTSVFSGGNTVMTMDMEGSDVLTVTISEVCLVTDGTGWTPIAGDPFGGTQINDITAGSVGGTKYWQMIGNGGRIAYSTDAGLTWTLATSGTSENLNQIAYGADNETFIAVGDDGVICRSTNGTTWSVDTTSLPGLADSGTGTGFGVIFDELNTDQWMILFARSPTQLYTVTSLDDGVTWLVAQRSAATGSPSSIQTGLFHRRASGQLQGGFLYNVGEDIYILTDSNDTTASVIYNTSSQPTGLGGSSFFYDGATNDAIVKGNQVNRGSTIVDDVGFGSSTMNDCAWSPTLERLVVVGEDSKIGTYEAADFDVPLVDIIELQSNGGNPGANYLCVWWDEDDSVFCAGNSVGQVVRSTNGFGAPKTPVTYTGFTLIVQDPFSGGNINRICSGQIGGTEWWVIIGGGGLLSTSTDGGVTWTSRTSGLSSNLISIAYNSTDEQFFVGAANGDFTTSTNGSTWTADTTTIAALGGAGSNAFLAVVWDVGSAEWWCLIAYNASITRRTYTTDVNVTTFTSRDTSVTATQTVGTARITTSGNQIVFCRDTEDFGFFLGSADTTDSAFSNLGPNGVAKCVATAPGSASFAHDFVVGNSAGGAKRYGGTGLAAGQARGRNTTTYDALTNVSVNGIAFSTVSNRFCIVCDNNEIYSLPQSSMDAPQFAYEVVNNPFTANINDVWYSPVDDVFIAVGSNGEIGRSTDGIS